MKKFIFTNSKKIYKRVVSITIAVFLVAVVLTTLFVIDSFAPANPKCYDKWVASSCNGSYDKEGYPSNYWEVKLYKNNATGENLTVNAKVSLPIVNTGTRYLGQIWVNISDMYAESLDVYTSYGSVVKRSLNANETPYTITSKDLKKSKDGWFKVYDYKDTKNFVPASPGAVDYWVGFSTQINVREIVFIDTAGDLISKPNSQIEYHGNKEVKGSDVNGLANAFDESKYFDLTKVGYKK